MPFNDFRIGEEIEAIDADIIQEIGDTQNAQDIIFAGPGNYFAYPTVGVAIVSQLNSEFQLIERQRSIRSQLKKDGFTITHYEDSLDSEGNFDTDLRAEK
jgi:hypothetical protein